MSLFILIFIGMFFWLLFGHFLMDFIFQNDTMAIAKSWNFVHPGAPWYYWMTAHCFMHAGAVTMITGSLFLGIGELVLHFAADCLKCAKIGNIHTDQLFHIACKVLWAYLATQGGLADVRSNITSG